MKYRLLLLNRFLLTADRVFIEALNNSSRAEFDKTLQSYSNNETVLKNVILDKYQINSSTCTSILYSHVQCTIAVEKALF